MSLTEVKLRPTTPWRPGHRSGDRERVDVIYHSDALYSALTLAMRALGWMDEWLDATARAAEPAVRLSSLFPFIGRTRLITPPGSIAGMRLVPLELARGGAYDPSRWQPDVPSESLLPTGSPSPFQVSVRSAAAVDRLTGAVDPHRIACLEFANNAGWWGVFDATPEWEPKVRSAFRLLADTGFGGERSRGWGRSSEPIFSTASALFPDRTPNGSWWLISLFSPHETDQIDWSKSTQTITIRAGWTETEAKRNLRMIEEGAVLSASSLRGRSVDVAPEGATHPAYRNGQALTIPLPPPPGHATAPPSPGPEPDLPEPDPEPTLPPIPGPEPMEMSAGVPEPEPQLPPPDPEPEIPSPPPDPEPEVPETSPDPEPMQMQDGHEAKAESEE